ncbi:hypothetical protein M409DRAFT_68765 [Zasmidium cellare ATCC 36951]|uniref:Amino acid transporter transmembrane domain-containing protein n=1 Tax=Zasmidium cellare ATCC 36951 TaxID=1080233 RepID=A0A6A6CCI9_ZASCE|nr:uncharacterized protein M409DRAFT_68765 [Zasmidium cellare ATCC 36951]KAF2163166.1 hypothetical protein M409DRAFT_68765 [Zasmidium cellare ATCC 36951]
MADEKKHDMVSSISPEQTDIDTGTIEPLKQDATHHEDEVFGAADGSNKVNFRTVGWLRASMFLMKQTFATGVLSMPSAMYFLGGVASPIFIIFWGVVNTYSAYIQGHYKLAHPKMHTIIDGAEISVLHLSGSNFWAKVAKIVSEVLYLFAWLLCVGLAVLAIGTALNAITSHGTCTVAFNVIAFIISTAAGSIRKIHGLGIILWVGFVSALASVLMVVIAVAIRSRPAYAPKTGPYDLGFQAAAPAGTTFAQAWAASIAIYASSANTAGYVPVMSEMRRPQDFFRALYVSSAFVNAAYLSLAMVMYAYAGEWVTSPSLGSAGPTIKLAAYAVALPGLIAVGMICIHVPAKTLFVRALRGSHHLTENTKTHWVVWIACTLSCGFIGWLLAVAIPFYTSLVSLIGSLGFGPLGVVLPPVLWFSLHVEYWKGSVKQRALVWLHVGMFLMGLFLSIGGTYANISNIVDQFKAGKVGTAFSCADNSATVVGG